MNVVSSIEHGSKSVTYEHPIDGADALDGNNSSNNGSSTNEFVEDTCHSWIRRHFFAYQSDVRPFHI